MTLVRSPLARQIVALSLAIAAVALSLAYPLRSYLEQQTQEQQAVAEQHDLQDQIADLKARKAALKDPAYIKAEAKRRLQYVSPGDTVYVVKLPRSDLDDTADGDGNTPFDPNDVPAGASDPGTARETGGNPATDAAGTGTSAARTGDATGSTTEVWYSSLWGTLTGDGH